MVIVGFLISNIKCNYEVVFRIIQLGNVEMYFVLENSSCFKNSFLLIREQGRLFLRFIFWKFYYIVCYYENVCSFVLEKIYVIMVEMLRLRIQILVFFLVLY